MIQQSLQNALARAKVDRPVATIVTQVVVDPDDAATHEPVKPIGHVMDAGTANAMAAQFGWTVAPGERGWRRLVPSPAPKSVVECDQIRRLVDAGTIVIAAGGGGTPVYRHSELGLEGVNAVIDKDRAAAVLGHDIGAARLLILTDVDGVYERFAEPDRTLLGHLTVAQAQQLLDTGRLGRGSMAPKVEAAVSFVRGGGSTAVIARLDRGLEAVEGKAGTTIVP
jgi:carbamate kinase